ncbi:MAG: methyltransferase domain-containing protein [Pseudomonadota bacterium]
MARIEKPQSPLFDARALAHRRDRAMGLGYANGADFVMREAALRVAERLGDVQGRVFRRAALAGTGAGAAAAALPGGLGGDGSGVVMTDPSPRMLAAAGRLLPLAEARPWAGETLPFDRCAADLALSLGVMHWLEDPVGHLIQLRLALKPDGLMIAVLPGGETLADMRQALAEAEIAETGGLSPRVAPMAELRAAGALLQRAGFAMPVADCEAIDVSYPDAWALMRDLRAMGETAAIAERLRRPTRRAIMARAAALYADKAGLTDGRVGARFDLIFLTGWCPAPDQPVPLRPGSARARLADALGVAEVPAGEKAGD